MPESGRVTASHSPHDSPSVGDEAAARPVLPLAEPNPASGRNFRSLPPPRRTAPERAPSPPQPDARERTFLAAELTAIGELAALHARHDGPIPEEEARRLDRLLNPPPGSRLASLSSWRSLRFWCRRRRAAKRVADRIERAAELARIDLWAYRALNDWQNARREERAADERAAAARSRATDPARMTSAFIGRRPR